MERSAARPNPEELARALQSGPFHVALRTALAARGLALHRVQHRLAQRGVKLGVTSLSYWQQGVRRPQRAESLRAVRALEEVLDLPTGALVRLLEPAPRQDIERPAARSYRSLLEVAEVLEQLLAGLDAPADGGLHSVGHFERVRIGARRELLGRDSQQLVRAHRDGVDRYLTIHRGEDGCAPERVTVRAAENCRVGRVRWLDGAPIVIAELLFDIRLRAGDTYVFGYAIEDGTGAASTEYQRGFPFSGAQYALQVRFHEAALPVRCHRFAQSSAGGPRTGRQELTLSGRHGVVHLAEQCVRAGILGIAWDWD